MLKSKCIGSNVIYYPQIKYGMVGINGPNSAIQTHGATFGNITINKIKIKINSKLLGMTYTWHMTASLEWTLCTFIKP